MFKILLICVFIVKISTCYRVTQENEKHSVIDAIIQGLNEEVWDDEEAPCFNKTLELLNNVKNFTLWATWVWDANKMPSGNLYGSWIQLSNYDQCMNPPWLESHPQFKTQYCTAEVKMTNKELKRRTFDPYESTEMYLKTKTRHGQRVHRFTWGVCILESCQPKSVIKILKRMYLESHFRAVSEPQITISECHAAGTTEELSTGYYVFVIMLITLFSISLVATCYRTHVKKQTTDNTVSTILESFCMKKNSAELTKSYKDEIKVLNGIRFLTSAGVVWLHITCLTVISGCTNSMDFDNRLFLYDERINLNLFVDTFFTMSGLLHIKGLLGRKQTNFFVILWKRYVRLIGLFALAIFYYASVVKYHGSGPFWNLFYNYESRICQTYWWLSMLMLNTSNYTYCYSVTWSIACDYQYTILSTILVFIYQKSKRLAITIFGFVAVASIAIPGILTYWYKTPPMFYLDLEDFMKLRAHDQIDMTYFNSLCRAGPYVVGMSVGYLMHVCKPPDYKQSLSTLLSIAGAAFSLILMGISTWLGGFFLEREYDVIEASIAAALYRSVWSAGVCGILICCVYGNLPFLTEFFSMSFFTPLSRLSFGLYLCHCLVMQQTNRLLTIKSPPVFDSFNVIVDTAGVGAVSLGISYVLWLILEAPLNRLSDHFICKRFQRREVEENNHHKKNEHVGEKIKAKAS